MDWHTCLWCPVKVGFIFNFLQVLLFNLLRDLVFIVIGTLKQAYHLSVAVAGYTTNAYRSFAETVDRMTKFYATQKSRMRIGGKSGGSDVSESGSKQG